MFARSKIYRKLVNKQSPILLAGTLLVLSSPVFSDTPVSLVGVVSPTEISGFAGTKFKIGNSEGTRALYGVWSVERNNKPCYIASMTENVNNSDDDHGALKDLCGAKAKSSEMKAQFGDAGFAKRTFVRALRVCTNNDGTRVKGLQIRGRKIDTNGNVSDLPTRYPDSSGSSGLSALVDLNAPSDDRPNCNGNWKKWAQCPEGQIATALYAHFSAGSKPRNLTGIALLCRAVSSDG